MARSSLEAVVATLRTWMREDGWPDSGLLPPTRKLAPELGCALQTLNGALRELEKLGLICKTPSGARWQLEATELAPHPVQDPLRERRSHRFRVLAEELQRELLAGRYGSNRPMPGVGQLQARFGCSWRTAKRVQEELIESGLARRRGRALFPRLPDTPARARANTFPEIWVTGHASLERTTAPWLQTHLLALERLAADTAGIRIRYHFVARPLEELPAPGREVMGILHFKSNFLVWRDWLLRHRIPPLVVLDAGERMRPVAGLIRRRPGSLGISSDNFAAGREMANYLARSGHKHVALLSPGPFERGWPLLRRQGLQTVFPAAPDPDGRFSVEYVAPIGTERRVSGLADTRAEDPASALPVPLRMLLVRHGFNAVSSAKLYASLYPAFVALSDRPEITAWVGITDLTAALAAGFLKALPPRTGSLPLLAGYDASPLSRALGFTSYDFDLESHMHLAFRFLAEPRSVPTDRQRLARIPGRLILREG